MRFGLRRLGAAISRRRRVLIAVGCTIAVLWWIRCGPLPAGLLDPAERQSTVVLDRNGNLLYEVRSPLGTRAELLEADALPPLLVSATLAAEDRRFRSHIGIDPIAVIRAAWRNVRAGKVVEGGSTITLQVAKLLLSERQPDRGRGWRAKINEATTALRLEHRLTKNEILALYLNHAPYGNQIQGAGRAARAYFGRSANTLTPAEAAFLAALPQQPSRFNPWRNAKAARGRQMRILAAMAARQALTWTDYQHARAERLSLTRETGDHVAPHFVERVLDRAGASRPRQIETTLDVSLQLAVRGIIAANRPALEEHRASNVAVAVLDNRTGEWLAWEGSGNYFDVRHGGAIDGVIAPRQPGSALKPFTYAAAFERGFNPARVLADVPSQFPTAKAGVLYSPRNYDGRFRGPLLVRAALAGSENVPAVALAAEIGVPAILRLLRQSGLTTLENNAAHYGLGITLGNAEVRLDELTGAYAMLARGGVAIAPQMIRQIDGRPVPSIAGFERVLSERTAFWITDILSDVEARAYIFGRGGSLEFPFVVAAKTGTSQSFHDNWAIGYTRDVTVGVWVGNFDRTPLARSSGVTGAGPIFHHVMLAAVERARGRVPVGDLTPIAAPTGDSRRLQVCALSGMSPTRACLRRVVEWLPAGASPAPCSWHHESDEGAITIWPEPYRHWARMEGLLRPPTVQANIDQPAPGGPPRKSASNSSGLVIVAPLAGAEYLIDSTLRPEFQTLPLRARGGSGVLQWFVDNHPIGSAEAGESLRWPLSRGRHWFTVKDEAGRSASASIVVR